jgi:hypothetical protein
MLITFPAIHRLRLDRDHKQPDSAPKRWPASRVLVSRKDLEADEIDLVFAPEVGAKHPISRFRGRNQRASRKHEDPP